MDFSAVDQARANANSAQDTATKLAAGGSTLPDELRKAVAARFETSDIAKTGATARADFLAAAPKAREDILGLINGGAILSPTQQASLMAAKRSSALVPVIAANALDTAAFGSMEDLINAGVGAYNKQATLAQGAADLASKNATNILNDLVTRKQLEQQAVEGPLDILLKKAQIAAANRSASGGDRQLDTIQLMDKNGNLRVYSFDPYTNKVGAEIGTPYNQQALLLKGQQAAEKQRNDLIQKYTKEGYSYDSASDSMIKGGFLGLGRKVVPLPKASSSGASNSANPLGI